MLDARQVSVDERAALPVRMWVADDLGDLVQIERRTRDELVVDGVELARSMVSALEIATVVLSSVNRRPAVSHKRESDAVWVSTV